jgi:hypothetical protein
MCVDPHSSEQFNTSENPMRRHSFFILLVLLGAISIGCDRDKPDEASSEVSLVDYQKKADLMEWRWSKEHDNLRWCISEHLADYEVKIIENEEKHWDPLTIQISKNGELVYEFLGHRNTVFTRSGSAIYISEYNPIASGCDLAAFDLGARKQLWRRHLRGIGPRDHSKYGNVINIEMDEGAILVLGNEVYGRYIEYVDPEKGVTLGNKKLPPEIPWRGWSK